MTRIPRILPLTITALTLSAASLPSLAAGDLSQQPPVEVKIQLGDKDNAMRFVPESIELETGKLYKLVLQNPSPQKHYFSSDGFATAVYTRKVQVLDQGGATLAEIKGTVREIEVYPGQRAEWCLVPVKAGTFSDLKCTIPGHADHGMTGTIVVR
jgi:uncharacterized cupredoxin-like copper-binding protein